MPLKFTSGKYHIMLQVFLVVTRPPVIEKIFISLTYLQISHGLQTSALCQVQQMVQGSIEFQQTPANSQVDGARKSIRR